MFKKIKTITIILLITLLPAFCFASGKIAAIKKGQKAPYNGILLDKTAEATNPSVAGKLRFFLSCPNTANP